MNNYMKNTMNKKNNMSSFGEFVYLRTYSRYDKELERREFWDETCNRVAGYNISLEKDFRIKNNLLVTEEILEEDRKLLEKSLLELKTFTSGRTLYIGGTDIVKEFPLSNYNCAFTDITELNDFIDIFYLLMVGSGVGLRLDRSNIDKLPKLKKHILNHEYDEDIFAMSKPVENTTVYFSGKHKDIFNIIVGDSKEGWCDALRKYFEVVANKDTAIKNVNIVYDYVRPAGAILKRFGGRASGHKSLERMFDKISKVINNLENETLSTLDCLDIATIISENVVSGGVRRSALMVACDEDDTDVINAKRDLYTCTNGVWSENAAITHRRMSNNSIIYNRKPTLNEIKDILVPIRENGEPGFINGVQALKRKEKFRGTNPCGEILLNSHQCCNLTTTNLMGFVEDNKLNLNELISVMKLSTRVAIRMTLVDLELESWDKAMKEDRIIGVSMTGLMDMMNATLMGYDELKDLLTKLRSAVHEEGNRFSKELGITPPSLMTTFKPEGTISSLPGVSSGVHFSHAPYYVRRVRVASSDPLIKIIDGALPIFNEVGQADENCTTKVVEFPIKAPKGQTKYDISALEQLELYKITMEHWTDHNTSITVHVRDNEWDSVANWLYQNFDSIVGVTFLPLADDSVYPLAPYEAISEEEYNNRVKTIKPFNLEKLFEIERLEYKEQEILDSDCASGLCPVR